MKKYVDPLIIKDHLRKALGWKKYVDLLIIRDKFKKSLMLGKIRRPFNKRPVSNQHWAGNNA